MKEILTKDEKIRKLQAKLKENQSQYGVYNKNISMNNSSLAVSKKKSLHNLRTEPTDTTIFLSPFPKNFLSPTQKNSSKNSIDFNLNKSQVVRKDGSLERDVTPPQKRIQFFYNQNILKINCKCDF